MGSKISTKYCAGGGDEGELREEETEHGERTALLEDEPADQVENQKSKKRKQRKESEQFFRESEGDLQDNSGMSISYCEGTAHSLPLVGSPRFLLVVVKLMLMSIIFDLLKLVLLQC